VSDRSVADIDFDDRPERGRLGGIRLHLVGLALIAALPLAGLSVGRILSDRAEANATTNLESMRAARLVAARLDERIRSADALLLGLSAELSMALSQRAHADSVLARTLRLSQGRYWNVFVADSVGTLRGTARPVGAIDTVGTLSDRAYFIKARQAKGYVIGDPMRGRLSPDSTWIVALVRPLRGENDSFRGIVGVSILLDSLADVVSTADLSGDPLVTIVDTSGLVIAQSVNAGSARAPVQRGQRRVVPVHALNHVVIGRFPESDSTTRVTGFARAATASWIVGVGMLQSASTAAARNSLLNDVLIFCLSVALAMLVAYLLAQGIVVPLTRLTDDARALTRGIAGRRAVASGSSEIRDLGEAFNQMADTVERRTAALADSERRYRLMFDSNPLPMWAWDADTQALLAVNEAAVEHYGYDRDTFLTLQILDLLHPGEHARFAASRLPFMESRQGAGVWKHRKANGDVIEMEVVTTSSRRLGRASWLSVGIDLTARRAAERALASSEERLRQSQKMEAIGAFAGGIAHDFNNLLTGMLGYCDLALSDMEPDAVSRADVEEVRGLALRGADLTRQILAVSRKGVVQPAYLDPNSVVRGLDRLLRRVIGEHIILQTELAENVGAVFADAAQLEQVLLNLAANARDAMPSGGHLRIATRPLAQPEVSLMGVAADREWVAITVHDTGTGMSDEIRQRIFEPFFTTKERGKGTGLGLALAYGMMEQAGGVIRVESAEGTGSSFHLVLPRHALREAPQATEATNVATMRGTETILVAEDEDSVRAVVTATLASRGYNVLAAVDGETALVLAQQYPHRIDLLLTDVVMPGINGRELAETMSRERPDVRVLYASGYTDDESLLQGIRTDELSFLQKPFSPADLVRRVRGLLDTVSAG
jgi:two-component system, cell cycle sensor histidine kinase and response regulator CckA